MSTYHPSSSTEPAVAGEEYELPALANDEEAPQAGPSKQPRRSSRSKTYTFHSNQSSALLFAAPGHNLPSPQNARHRHARSSSYPDSPTTPRVQRLTDTFLADDDLFGTSHDHVTVPDFGHMLGFMPDAVEDPFVIAQGMRSRWKRRLFLLMEEPSSGREAFFVHVMVTGAILFSALLTVISTLPAFHTDPSSTRTLFGLDTTIVVLFTIEYIARTMAHSDSWRQYYNWATSFFALLDLIAIFPYYIEVARQDDTSILFRFSILRTFRLLRVFRAFRYQNQILLTIEVMYVAVHRSKDALVALSFFILLVLVFFATLIYFAERGTWEPNLGLFVDADGDPSQFDSIPQTAWFALVTMSTVGYGDVVPRSFLGKLLTMPLLPLGLLAIAPCSFVMGRNFAMVFDAMAMQAHREPSAIGSARHSIEGPATPPATTQAQPAQHTETSSAPLLPSTSSDITLPRPVPALGTASRATPMLTTGSSAGRTPIPPRMWDGAQDVPPGSGQKAGDLTNIKLAKNQLVLLEQISLLQRTVERQGEILERLLAAGGMKPGSRIMNGEAGPSRLHRLSSDEHQFALGVSDDEREGL